jgi:IS605 OrfB family transposase
MRTATRSATRTGSSSTSAGADHRDARIRHALTRLLHWVRRCGVKAIGIEDLDFAAEKTREKHGRKKRFRRLISGMPTGKLKARLVSMAAEVGLAIVAVDPAYTSMWGDNEGPRSPGRKAPTCPADCGPCGLWRLLTRNRRSRL